MLHRHLAVHPQQVIQDNWLGANAIYHGYAYQPDDAGRQYTEAQAALELDRLQQMEFHIARTYYNSEYAYDFDQQKWAWDEKPEILAFYRWCEELQKRGIDIALQAAWWLPGDLNGSVSRNTPFAKGNSWDELVAMWTEWVSESLHQLIELRGFTHIKYLIVFTEPGYTSGKLAEGQKQHDIWVQCVRALHDRLVADGRRDLVKLVGPNEGSTETSEMLEYVVPLVNDCVDIYSSHTYYFNWEKDFDLYPILCGYMETGLSKCAATGKPYWFDEYGLTTFSDTPPTVTEVMRWNDGLYGKYLALWNLAALNTGVQSTILWTVLDQQWPNSHSSRADCWYDGEHRWGVAPTLRQSETPYPCYYAYSLISKYLGGEGTKVFAVTDEGSVRIGAVRTADGHLTLLVV
ncbi:MAG: hypothetical protein IIX68_01230, partial [Clostridia bacterium]|nr:hypothetical protein [Clostridia bacterium]